MRNLKPFFVGLIFLAATLTIAYDVSYADVEEDISEIKRELGELKKDVAEIKKLLQGVVSRARAPEKTTAVTTIDNDPVLGSPTAPVTLVEFSDYQCPYCARFFKTTYPALLEDYIKKGKLRYVYRDFPLPFHKKAQKAHEAASCAGEQGKYWEMHDFIFANQAKMEVENLKEYAGTLSLDMASFNACLDSGKYVEEIKKDIDDGRKAGVRGTPSFVLGATDKSGQVKGLLVKGAQPLSYFKTEIDRLLKETSGEKSSR